MPHRPLLIPPCGTFWPAVAHALLEGGMLRQADPQMRDFSGVRVVVPSFTHAQHLKSALAAHLKRSFIPPRITTMAAWLELLPPEGRPTASHSERMMSLYAELRQHAWLKKLFSARRNTDLLPLAQLLLKLFDELTEALLPSMHLSADAAEERWQAALGQLSPPARNLLSDEAQLVWSLWKSQLGTHDATAVCFAQMLRVADAADAPLIWISPDAPNPMERSFLAAYAARQPVWPVTLDWCTDAIAGVYASAWPEIRDEATHEMPAARVGGHVVTPPGVALRSASSLEDEALHGAQTVLDWLAGGKNRIAIIAQDRVVARRIRALLERASILVADETGWKLSTTRTAAAIAALLDVISTRAETMALLDLLKSPFFCADVPDKPTHVMEIEHALRRFNIQGGWDAAISAVSRAPAAQDLLRKIAAQAGLFAGRRSLPEWGAVMNRALDALGMRAALEADAAGVQVIRLLDMLMQDCDRMAQPFSFSEWRAFLSLQLESTPFLPADADRRVVMLQLNGARLRSFDAVLMVGTDADHLPSKSTETLFFANAVRRELGLATRELRQRAQLRDFTEVLSANPQVVLSWQAHKNGEPNPVSPWIERLQLTLERAGVPLLPAHRVTIASQLLQPARPVMPAPSAPALLPRKLSASGYNSLVACPYQFFATRMLGLAGLDELSDMPEKRDYGDWLHAILKTYHEAVRDRQVAPAERVGLLRDISEKVFSKTLDQSAAALGYYARWQKAMPAYLDWASDREANGWQFASGEQWFEKTLNWSGGQIALHGCVDRIDENETGERALLDYKTKPVQALRDKLKEAEDHQLAFYGLLSDRPVVAAHFVALELTKGQTGDAEAKNYSEWQTMLEAQIVNNINAIAQGAAMSATGVERICVYCEVRGLCRKGAW